MAPVSHQNPAISPARIKTFLMLGSLYGAVWSLVPGYLSELLSMPGEAATVILSGAMTGIIVSAALVPVLARCKRWQAIGLGVLALPVGAWLFGFVISCIHWVVMKVTGMHYRFVMQIVEPPGYIFNPLQTAKLYALYATLSAFGIVFIPLAIFTTLHLRRRIAPSPVIQVSDSFLFM
jgi:hypothetical protein